MKLPPAPEPSLPTRATGIAPQSKTFLRVEAFLVLACALSEFFCALVLHLKGPFVYPFLSPFFDFKLSFWDFRVFAHRFCYFHQPAFFTTDPIYPFMYPAPVAVLYKIFFSFPVPLLFFLGFMLGSFLVAGRLFERALWRRGVAKEKASSFIAVSLLLAYPLWFDLKQGNIEIAIWVLVAAGVWAFCTGKNYRAAACFAIAGSMKIFPFLYLGLLLSRRRYRETIFAAVVAISTTVASLWLVGGRDLLSTWRQVEAGVDDFRTMYALHFRPGEIGFDHSLFAMYKYCRIDHPPPEVLAPTLTLYLAVAALSGIALYLLRIRHLPVLNQVLCLCIASILLPPVSYEYTLMNLYVPWAMLVLFAQEQWSLCEKVPGLTAAFVCLAILVAPLGEFFYDGQRFGGQIKAGVLMVLLYLSLKYPFERLRTAYAAIDRTDPSIISSRSHPPPATYIDIAGRHTGAPPAQRPAPGLQTDTAR